MKNIELFERIERYLNDRLSKEEKEAFEMELRSNPELVAELELHRDMLSAIPPEDELRLRELMDQAYKNEFNEVNAGKGGLSFVRTNRFYWAAAAVLVFAVAGIWLFTRNQPTLNNEGPSIAKEEVQEPSNPLLTTVDSPSNEEPLKRYERVEEPTKKPNDARFKNEALAFYNSTPYNPGTLMGSGDDISTTALGLALDAYKKNDYSKTVELLDSIPASGATEALKLRAHSNFRLERFDTAVDDFLELRKSFSYKNDAEWFLLLCYAAQLPDSNTKFKSMLEVVSSPGHPFEKKGAALKEKLEFD